MVKALLSLFLFYGAFANANQPCESKLLDGDYIAAAAKAVRGALENPDAELNLKIIGRARVDGIEKTAVRVDYVLDGQSFAAMVYFRSRSDGRVDVVDDGPLGLNLRPDYAVIDEVRNRPGGSRVTAAQTRAMPYGWQVTAAIETPTADGVRESSQTFEVYLKPDMTLGVMPVAVSSSVGSSG